MIRRLIVLFAALTLGLPAFSLAWTPAKTTTPLSGQTLERLVVADFNHDGKADAAVVVDNHVTVLEGDGTGAFPHHIASLSIRAVDIAAGDFNGDGNEDLAIVGQSAYSAPYRLVIFYGDGKGGFSPASIVDPASLPPLDASCRISAATLTSRSRTDRDLVLSCDSIPDTLVGLVNQGNSTFQAKKLIVLSSTWRIVNFSAADTTGSGVSSIAVQSVGSSPGSDVETTLYVPSANRYSPQPLSQATASLIRLANLDGGPEAGFIAFTHEGINAFRFIYSQTASAIESDPSCLTLDVAAGNLTGASSSLGADIVAAQYCKSPITHQLGLVLRSFLNTSGTDTTITVPAVTSADTPVPYRISVTPISGTGMPSGAVGLSVNNGPVKSLTLAAGHATGTTTLEPGPNTLTAVYPGDSDFSASWRSAAVSAQGSRYSPELARPILAHIVRPAALITPEVSTGAIQIPPPGIIETITGNGTETYSGDGGPATSAGLDQPEGLAVDSHGNVYIAGTWTYRIREINAATGIITTIAGNGTQGYSGDGGPATNAELNGPNSVAVDSHGNLYIDDENNFRVREVNAATGIITTIAGNGTAGYSGDGGPATNAELDGPTDLAVDSTGNLYIADAANNRIREVNAATGIITTIAGNGTAGYSGDGGLAINAELGNLTYITVDSAGNVYIADTDNNRVREVNAATGIITTIAGNGTQGYSGDGGPATSAELNGPRRPTVDSRGNIYIPDSDNRRVREVNAATGIITTVAGSGAWGYSGDGGPAVNAELTLPFSLAGDSQGNLYFIDADNNRIRVVGTPQPYDFTVAELASNTNPVHFAQPVTFTALVDTGGNEPAGNVTFTSNGSSIGSVAITPVTTTNLLPYSSTFQSWNNNPGVVITPNATTAPDGSNTASLLIVGPSSQYYVGENGFPCPAGTLTYSIWLKEYSSNPSGSVFLSMRSYDSSGATLIFTGLNITPAAAWRRYSFQVTAPAGSATCWFGVEQQAVAGQGGTAAPGNGVYAWGTQIEAAATVGPYIATGASANSGFGGVATLSTSSLPVGSDSIGATFSGDANDSASTSDPLAQQVNAVAPGSPTIGAATAGDASATVSFTPPSDDGGSAITSYTATSSPGGISGTCSASPCTVTGLTNGISYTFTVTATTTAGTSDPSAVSNAVIPQGSQTISFANPGSQTFGAAPTLIATASSGLAVVFTSSTTSVCTVTSGGTMTFVSAGSCTIDANQPGDAAFAAAPEIAQIFTISQAASTVSLSCSPTSLAFGAQTTCTATVPSPDGTVTFYTPVTLSGEWWNGTSSGWMPAGNTGPMSTAPVAMTHDGSLNYNINASEWAYSWPGAMSAPSGFNTTYTYARWTGTFVSTIGGTYTIGVNSDDGANVYVNGTEIISNLSTVQGANVSSLTYTQSATVSLAAGATNTIVVEWQNGVDGSGIQLLWTPPGQSSPSLLGQTIVPVDSSSQASFTETDFVDGSSTITADYSGDAEYAVASDSTTVTAKSAPISSITSSLNPSTAGQGVTLTALVNTGGSAPAGSVTFTSNGTSIGTGTLSSVSTSNLEPYSTDFSHWTFQNLTPATGATAPDGSVTATSFTCSTACSSGDLYSTQFVPTNQLVLGNTYTVSFWMKASANSSVQFFGAATDSASGWTNYISGTAQVTTSWQRFQFSGVLPITDESGLQLYIGGGYQSGVTYDVWGVQVEQGSTAGPYIATDGSPESGYGGEATLSTSSLPVGADSIIASYSGDANDAASTNEPLTQQVNAVAPGAPTIGTATAGNAEATVSFTPPSDDGGASITGYTASSSPGGITGSCSASPCAVAGLTNGTSYTFTVTATTTAGTSGPSAASNAVIPLGTNQTISFANPGAEIYGTSPTLTATASSGLVVSFTSATPSVCTITSGGALSFVSGGSCTINANQPGNATYAAAPEVSQTFAVGQATPTLTWAAPASIVYGTPLSSTELDATASVPGAFSYTPAAGAILNAGSETLSVTFTPTDSTDYATVTKSVTLAVSTAPVTISTTSTINPSSYGETVTFTFTVTGASGGTIPSGSLALSGPGIPTNTTAAMNASGVATYTTPLLPTGTDDVKAAYSGDTNYH